MLRRFYLGLMVLISFICWSNLTLAKSIDQGKFTWPRELVTEKGTLTLYQPQAEKLSRSTLYFRMAVAVKRKGDKEQKFGAINAQCTLDVDKDEGTGFCDDFKISKVNFPANPEKADEFKEWLNEEVADHSVEVSVDRIKASLKVAKITSQKHKQNFDFTPPIIYLANEPTALISIDGKPVMRPVKDSSLMQVINTPFVVLFDSSEGQYYLRVGTKWMSAEKLNDKWQRLSPVPSAVRKLETQKPSSDTKSVNNVIVTTEPAALIEFDGPTEYSPIENTDLLYVTNTDSDVFLQIKSQRNFVLLSGRWYSTKKLNANSKWRHIASNKLPKTFAKIPESSPKANVLASVSGSASAEEAVIQNQIPTTAVVDRKNAKLTVDYDGEPKFERIKGTSLRYAVNTGTPVVQYKKEYFANDQGVWFFADSALGPWAVADNIPDEIYDIPPEHPLYQVTYSYVYGADKDEVLVGYTPGYQGSYSSEGTVIYGTGYDYSGWSGDEYYGYPATYGYDCYYDPYNGWYPRAHYVDPVWFGVGLAISAVHGAIWYDRWNNYRRVNYNTHYNKNVYRRWDKSAIKDRGDRRKRISTRDRKPGRDRLDQRPTQRDRMDKKSRDRAQLSDKKGRDRKARDSQRSKKASDRKARDSQRGKGARDRKNNVYAGPDGNVYRKKDKGGWQKSTSKGWKAESNSKRSRQLDRQKSTRSRGNQLSNRRSSSPRARGGGGGGRRGSGGRSGGGRRGGGGGGRRGGGGGRGGRR